MPKSSEKSLPFLKFVAYLQIIGIILVVFGHSFHEYPDGEHGFTLFIYRLFYNFRMPLFMFVSGFLLVYTTFRRGYLSTIRSFGVKKIKRLLLPYFVLTLITYFPRAAMSSIADDEMPMTFEGMIESLFLADKLPIPFFWFIQASFILLIFTYSYLYFCHKFRISGVASYIVLILIFLSYRLIPEDGMPLVILNKISELGIFFVLGSAYCASYESISKYLPLDNWVSFGLSGALWLTSFIFWEGSGLALISSILGILMCICGAKMLVKYKITVLDHLVGANYMIFLLSWYFNVLSQQVLSHYLSLPWWVYTLMSLTFGVYFPWLGYVVLRKYQHTRVGRVLAFLLGQSFKASPSKNI